MLRDEVHFLICDIYLLDHPPAEAERRLTPNQYNAVIFSLRNIRTADRQIIAPISCPPGALSLSVSPLLVCGDGCMS